MNNKKQIIKTMIKRDLLIQARDKYEFIFRVAMLPFILIVIYGYVLPKIGIVSADFPKYMFPGMVESWIGALIVLPISLIFMNEYLSFSLSMNQIFMLIGILILASITSATLGLLVGTIVKPMQIAAMFPGFLMPLVFTGAIFFTWNALSPLPIFKALVLINPLVYINESLRTIIYPTVTSMPLLISIAGMVGFTILMGVVGFKRFMNLAKN